MGNKAIALHLTNQPTARQSGIVLCPIIIGFLLFPLLNCKGLLGVALWAEQPFANLEEGREGNLERGVLCPAPKGKYATGQKKNCTAFSLFRKGKKGLL